MSTTWGGSLGDPLHNNSVYSQLHYRQKNWRPRALNLVIPRRALIIGLLLLLGFCFFLAGSFQVGLRELRKERPEFFGSPHIQTRPRSKAGIKWTLRPWGHGLNLAEGVLRLPFKTNPKKGNSKIRDPYTIHLNIVF